ncbi:Tigger transposable element-derived protein 4 [Araneus ventricosus]|nr:Tigger transposable element-derived protein 4 [Araneus ventricosus]
MDGSEKIIPLVIGKFLRPRCMKNCKSLPLFYDANSKAWMTVDFWEKTLRRWDLNFSQQKRKVALIADNCTAHCTVYGLKSIELVFLLPNRTCVLQPLDQAKSSSARYDLCYCPKRTIAICVCVKCNLLYRPKLEYGVTENYFKLLPTCWISRFSRV